MMQFLIVAVMAFVVEAVVEYFFGLPFDNVKKWTPYKWALPYFAAAVGIAGAAFYHLDLFALISATTGSPIPPHPFGIALTGLAIARGSNFIHLVWKFVVSWIGLILGKTEQAERRT